MLKKKLLSFLHINPNFNDLESLIALSNELEKLNVVVEVSGDVLTFERKENLPQSIKVSTYNDHGMAMSFAPLAKLGLNVWIENPNVVDKSYISYWDNFKSFYFRLRP